MWLERWMMYTETMVGVQVKAYGQSSVFQGITSFSYLCFVGAIIALN